MTKEVWIPVLGYEGYYEVSNLGEIRRDVEARHRSLGVPGKKIKPVRNRTGYERVSLSKDGVVTGHNLHRIILSSFCGPPPFEGAQAAHNDGDNGNNVLTNLRWASPKENQSDVDRHGMRCRGEDVFGAVLVEESVRKIRWRISQGERNRPIAEDFGVSISTIHLIRHNRIWRHVK